MVRETRLSWDDSLSLEVPDRRDRFDDLDDEFLDVFATDNTPAAKPAERERKKRSRSPNDSNPRRHLAGADWLRDEPKPPQRS